MSRHGPQVAARTRLRAATVIIGGLALAAGLAGPATAAPAEAAILDVGTAAPDREIVAGTHAMSSAEVMAGDVTGTALADVALAGTVNISSMRVYTFGGDTWAIPADTPFTAVTGFNAAGERVYQLIPRAVPLAIAPQAGYAVPSPGAFAYNNSNSFSQTVGTWKREVWWTITKANDWKACSTCTAFDYYRLYSKMRASSLTGSGPNEGFKRAWIELDHQGGTSLASFEPDAPEESYAGAANQTISVGFGSTFGINIGAPPLSGSGSINTTYGGTMTQSSENWHPIIRSELGSGGVQWCRYASAEFTGTKLVSTRSSVRTSSSGSAGSWNFLLGQQDVTSSCPSQI